ncbi:hypothetical protein [Trueperella bialowiezensis]|uniref:Alpha/beta hydrolase family n=1 Tax=Trueperella bialowiezensis TaxID=312285 RepID=A0A448PEZ4_9ACTO|nr:hypothetical protein [Trueperella bialowiezensis]VEI13515.1 Uncharacterised protein [Trueperella bialowiezensis]
MDGTDIPVRGILTMPDSAESTKPKLIFVGHLRTPNCSDESFAYPCPAGTEEVRPDQGMTYFGEAMAERGYATLIPDLSVAYSEKVIDENQADVIRQITEKLAAEAKLSDRVNSDGVDMLVHSRSGTMVEAFSKGLGMDVSSVFAYGPVYLTPGDPLGPDTDYLAVMGEQDFEASDSANLWISGHIAASREHPATVISVPQLGHNYINRALSERNFDDRIVCDVEECASAADHEKFLIESAYAFFTDREIPEHNRILAVPGGMDIVRLTPRDFEGTVCQRVDSMDPTEYDNKCADPEIGVIIGLDEMLRLGEAKAQLASVPTKALVVHALPVDQPASLTVTVGYASGESETLEIAPDTSMLRDRETADANDIYLVGSERVELAGGDVVSIELSAPDGDVEVRGIDLIP